MSDPQEWNLEVDVDAVLRGQGADAKTIRRRNRFLVELARRALKEGLPLVKPRVYRRSVMITEHFHERIHLADGHLLTGSLLANHLAPAEKIVAILCTIGSELEQYAAQVWEHDMPYSLALDGLGSAATEALANAACAQTETDAKADGMQASIPLSPGMEGWPTGEGQMQIFTLWEQEELEIRLSPSGMMLPRKSLSMVTGIGKDMVSGGNACEYCSMRAKCHYQDHYPKRPV
jgi:hypothetical protein